MPLIKPPRLQPGQKVAAVTLSWGGPGTFPHRYQAGKRQFEQEFGLEVVEMPHALADPAYVADHPEARVADLHQAFADPQIAGIISTIGGDDSIRLLPHLDLELIRAHPKIFMGFSDTTVTHLALFQAGLVSFYGPSFMAGFAENTGMFPYMVEAVRKILFTAAPPGRIAPNPDGWTAERLDWDDPANQERPRKLRPPLPWKIVQGRGRVRGRLLGGCLEVLEFLRGTPVWPPLADWEGAILFLETSEDQPPPQVLTWALRSLAAMGILERLAGILLGRPQPRPGFENVESDFAEYEAALLQVVAHEEGLTSLPILTRLDFGHTDPMFVLPYGVEVEINCDITSLTIMESAVR